MRDDSISRQAAIDAVCKCTDIYTNNLPVMVDKASVYKALEKLPSAQPESIKCKDCRHAEERGCALFCGFWTGYTAHKGYCFKAERRE